MALTKEEYYAMTKEERKARKLTLMQVAARPKLELLHLRIQKMMKLRKYENSKYCEYFIYKSMMSDPPIPLIDQLKDYKLLPLKRCFEQQLD